MEYAPMRLGNEASRADPHGWKARADVTDEERQRAASYSTLVPQHAALVARVAASLVGTADAEDVAQEVAVQAWRHWGDLREPAALRAWLVRITVNTCYQWRRSARWKAGQSSRPLDTFEEGELPLLATHPGTSDFTGALDLRRAINRLPSDLRAVVVLRYYAGMDATEAGETLGIPSATVRTRLRRALAALRDHLEGPHTSPSNEGGAPHA